jgi:hypothetical protein
MKPNDKTEFVQILNGLAEIKPGKELTAEGLRVFWNAMQDWSIEDFRSAANHLAKSCEFMPNPFHFEQLRKKQEPTKHEAWAIALSRANKPRSEGNPEDKVTKAVRMIGGYYQLGMTSYDQLPFLAKRFQDVYDSINEVEDIPQLSKPEAGTMMRRLIG